MSFQPSHYGLFFTRAHVEQARKNQQREPLQSAWAFLNESAAPTNDIVYWNALRWCLADDPTAGEQATAAFVEGIGLQMEADSIHMLRNAVCMAQSFEMTRSCPAFTAEKQAAWAESFRAFVDALNTQPDDLDYPEQLWLSLVNLVTGIVLEDEARFQHAAEGYRQVIAADIRPEGYMPKAVEDQPSDSLHRQLLAVEALVLMAEAAAGAGLDLWSYAVRGVSVVTAASYLGFYYYYPEKWQWGEVLPDTAQTLFRQHGAFFEIVNHRARLRDIKLMLDETRPLYAPSGGGLTTLTHAPAARRGLFR